MSLLNFTEWFSCTDICAVGWQHYKVRVFKSSSQNCHLLHPHAKHFICDRISVVVFKLMDNCIYKSHERKEMLGDGY